MAFSSDYYGLQIMRKNEPFKERRDFKLDGVIEYWASKDTLVISSNANDTTHARDTFPEKISYEKYDNIVIKHIHDHAGTGGGIHNNTFNSLEVKDNVITFQGININEKDQAKEFRYPLGAIIVHAIKDSLTKIEFIKSYKSMNFTRIDKAGRTLHNQAEIGSDTYEFTPTKKITTKSLGHVGIFYDYTIKANLNPGSL